MSVSQEFDRVEKEIDRIQETAEKQLASVNGLNVSLVKKVRKLAAQATALLIENKDLEKKNAALLTQLGYSQGDAQTPIKDEHIEKVGYEVSQASGPAGEPSQPRPPAFPTLPIASTTTTNVPQEFELDKEIDRIQKTAEKQLAAVYSLNVSLVRKIRKSEEHTAALLVANRELKQKYASLTAQLKRAQAEDQP